MLLNPLDKLDTLKDLYTNQDFFPYNTPAYLLGGEYFTKKEYKKQPL
jgi:hypothetical protein